MKRFTNVVRNNIVRQSLKPQLNEGILFSQSRNYTSTFGNIEMGPIDPILGIQEQFVADSNPDKINLVVGAYRTDEGKPWILPSVHASEQKVLTESSYNHEYGPIAGNKDMCESSKILMFGDNAQDLNSICTMQALSGTGALRVIGGFIKEHWHTSQLPTIYCPNPTWANHHNIFQHAGLQTTTYPYFDQKTKGLDFDGMISSFKNLGNNDVVILHAVAHNPTGVDPTQEQWKEICNVLKKQGCTVLFDSAYQGFASGDCDRDAFAVRYFRENDIPMMVAQSYAKNFGLYGHRVGAVHLLCKDNEERIRVESQAKIVARAMYSNPPLHGAKIVTKILTDPTLKQQWLDDVKSMAVRIDSMRSELKNELINLGSSLSWQHITDQIGMFCFTGVSSEQVDKLKSEHSVYLTKNGRISMAGVNTNNVKRIANAFHSVTK